MKKRLKEISSITMGQSPSSKYYNLKHEGIPFLQGCTTFGSIYPTINTWTTYYRKKALPGDILFTVRAPVGDVNICKETTAIGRGLASIRATNVLPLYLFYLLQANKDKFKFASSGTIYESINIDKLSNIYLNVHNMDDQQHIVDTIGTIDDLIEKYSSIIIRIEEEVLLKFELFENKNISFVSDSFSFVSGGVYKSIDYQKNGIYKLITIKNIDDNGFSSNNVDRLNNPLKGTYLNLGDILLTMTGNIGRVGIVDEDNCLLNQRVLKIDSISKAYVYAYLKKYKGLIIQLGKGTAQKNLSLEDLKKMSIHNSSQDIKTFRKYDYLFDLIIHYKVLSKKLRDIKRLLLNNYF